MPKDWTPWQSTKRLLPLPALLPSPVPGTNGLANTRKEPWVIASYGHDHFVGGLLPRLKLVVLWELCGWTESRLVILRCRDPRSKYTLQRVVPASIHMRGSVLVSPFFWYWLTHEFFHPKARVLVEKNQKNKDWRMNNMLETPKPNLCLSASTFVLFQVVGRLCAIFGHIKPRPDPASKLLHTNSWDINPKTSLLRAQSKSRCPSHVGSLKKGDMGVTGHD